MLIDRVTIPARFNGPPGTANGGYTCGLVAEAIGPDASVRLMHPPPLDKGLDRHRSADGLIRLRVGDTTIAEGRAARPSASPPAVPSASSAARAGEASVARDPNGHAFPMCFVCGPLRDDGLRIFPGPTGDDAVLACIWRPAADLAVDGAVDSRFVWAALDCPSGFACLPPGARIVLASMTASLQAPVEPARDYIVTAWPITSEGRKHRAGSAMHDAHGHPVAIAEALWISLRENT